MANEAEFRAAVGNAAVSEVVVTASFALAGSTDVAVNNRALTLTGACGGGNCVLDASDNARHLYVTGASANLVVSGLTFTNGKTSYVRGVLPPPQLQI